eukprot:COSAG05_NODE_774_length_7437_cov_53.159853_7_plen_79_part_00
MDDVHSRTRAPFRARCDRAEATWIDHVDTTRVLFPTPLLPVLAVAMAVHSAGASGVAMRTAHQSRTHAHNRPLITMHD